MAYRLKTSRKHKHRQSVYCIGHLCYNFAWPFWPWINWNNETIQRQIYGKRPKLSVLQCGKWSSCFESCLKRIYEGLCSCSVPRRQLHISSCSWTLRQHLWWSFSVANRSGYSGWSDLLLWTLWWFGGFFFASFWLNVFFILSFNWHGINWAHLSQQGF